jgi:hypothetical protein
MIDDAEGVPRLLSISDVAKHLHKSKRWLQYFLKENPFGRMAGRTRLFTDADLAALIESLPKPGAAPGLPALEPDPSEAASWAKLQRLLATKGKKRSARRRRSVDGEGRKPD